MIDYPRQLELQHVHQPNGWLSPGYLRIGADGLLESVTAEKPEGWSEQDTLSLDGFALPGMPNLHSHSFQRAMAGKTEQRSRNGDSFWSWRSSMYALAARIAPEQLEAITTQLYVEMLLAGMTAVGEFHYLHRDQQGMPYEDPAELGKRIISAADRSGIALTLLPVLYLHGGFEAAPIEGPQRRFAHEDVEDFLSTVARLRKERTSRSLLEVGIAPHSLRAVTEPELRDVIRGSADWKAPIHIHIAEQEREVAECSSALGRRPIDWLMDRFEPGPDWCLVHATHANESELQRLAASDAVAGLCPTTEANLGDGVFPLAAFLAAGGSFGIGSDSQISVSVAEELRLLEYGQRLELRRRNVSAGPEQFHVGRRLYDAALAGGARALGLMAGSLTPGRRADLVVLDPADPRLASHGPETALDAHVFASVGSPVRDVMVGGSFVVRDGRHFLQDEILEEYVAACRQLGT